MKKLRPKSEFLWATPRGGEIRLVKKRVRNKLCQKKKCLNFPLFAPFLSFRCFQALIEWNLQINRRFALISVNISHYSKSFMKNSEKPGEEIRNFCDGGGEEIRDFGQNIYPCSIVKDNNSLLYSIVIFRQIWALVAYKTVAYIKRKVYAICRSKMFLDILDFWEMDKNC